MRRLRDVRLPILGSFFAICLLLLAACGGTGGSGSGSGSGSGASGACDPMPKVTFTEKLTPGQPDQYFFNPKQVSIKKGEYVSFTNQTDEIHTLVTTPDAGLDDSNIDKNESQPVQFKNPGTFTVESQNAEHRGSMQVTVSSDAGTTCGMNMPATAVKLSEKVGPPDQYSFAPNSVTIKKGASLTVNNLTDEDHTLSCTPDPGIDSNALAIDKNENQTIQFPNAGTFTCKSTEHPDATMTVTVQ